MTDPAMFLTSQQWVPVAIGAILALGVHLVKATARPVVNATTVGVGAPVASAAEDAGSFVLAFAALLTPVLVLLGVVLIAILVVSLARRRRSKRVQQQHPST